MNVTLAVFESSDLGDEVGLNRVKVYGIAWTAC